MHSIDISTLNPEDLLEFCDTNITDFSNFEIEVQYQADYGQTKMIRDTVLYLFERNSINVPWKNRFALISDELVNNSIAYGSQPLEQNTLYVKFETEDGKLKVLIEVTDTGKWIEAKTSLEMEEIRRLKEAQGFEGYLGKRGRGLFQLVTNLVDELYFRDQKTGWLVVGIRKELEMVPTL